MTTRIDTETPCPRCGSAACLVQSPRFCRHTGGLRESPETVDSPPADKMLRRGKPDVRRK